MAINKVNIKMVDGLEDKLGNITNEVNAITSNIETLENHIDDLDVNLNQIEQSITQINQSIIETNQSIINKTQSLGDIASLNEDIKTELESNNKEIDVVNAINYIYENGGGGSGTFFTVASIDNLSASSSPNGTSISLTWKNPSNREFSKVELYASMSDISKSTLDYCKSNATIVYNSNGESYTKQTQKDKKWYFKAFAKHEAFDTLFYSDGVAVNVTTKDNVPPSPVTNLASASGDKKITLTWVKPNDADLASVKVVYKLNTYPANVSDGNLAYSGLGEQVVLENLENDLVYYFRIFTVDTSNNINSDQSMKITASPQGVHAPLNFTANGNLSGTQISLSWENPTDTSLQKVEMYVSETNLTNLSREQCQNTGQRIVNSKITSYVYNSTPNKTYYFKLFAIHMISGVEKVSSGIVINTVAEDKQPPSSITNFKIASVGNKTISLSWENPSDNDFNKTKILYKTNSYPSSQTDGNVAYEGNATSVNLNNLLNDTTYYFRAFTFDHSGNVNTSTTGMQVSGTPTSAQIYGVNIDFTDITDGDDAITYTDSAIGMSSGSSTWDTKFPFNRIRPVLLKNGSVVKEINKTNFSVTTSGEYIDDYLRNGCDLMIEFPKIWWKFERNGKIVSVRYSDKQVDTSWKALAHTKNGAVKDYCYIGAFLGYIDGDKTGNSYTGRLRSITGQFPTQDQTLEGFRTHATRGGSGYRQYGYYQHLMLQILYMVRYKSGSSHHLGFGYGRGHESWRKKLTGKTYDKGMYYGVSNSDESVKFAGIEDIYGYSSVWIEGFRTKVSDVLLATDNFNDDGIGYTNYGFITTNGFSAKMRDIYGTTETGFLIKEKLLTTGNSIWNDVSSINPNGYGSTHVSEGLFSLCSGGTASATYYALARLCYL